MTRRATLEVYAPWPVGKWIAAGTVTLPDGPYNETTLPAVVRLLPAFSFPWQAEAARASPMWAWIIWRDHGSPPNLRPEQIPVRIPPMVLAMWRARYAIHKGTKP